MDFEFWNFDFLKNDWSLKTTLDYIVPTSTKEIETILIPECFYDSCDTFEKKTFYLWGGETKKLYVDKIATLIQRNNTIEIYSFNLIFQHFFDNGFVLNDQTAIMIKDFCKLLDPLSVENEQSLPKDWVWGIRRSNLFRIMCDDKNLHFSARRLSVLFSPIHRDDYIENISKHIEQMIFDCLCLDNIYRNLQNDQKNSCCYFFVREILINMRKKFDDLISSKN